MTYGLRQLGIAALVVAFLYWVTRVGRDQEQFAEEDDRVVLGREVEGDEHPCGLVTQGFVSSMRSRAREGSPSLGGGPGKYCCVNKQSVEGLNGAYQPKLPKREWRRGGRSLSISRHTQHHFMYWFLDHYRERMPSEARCLDWDGWYGGSVFGAVCKEVDVIEYKLPFGRVANKRLFWSHPRGRNSTRWYYADAHTMSSVLDKGVYDLVILNSVMEHMHNPFLVFREVVAILAEGGLVFFHAPTNIENHGVPYDFWRYTASGARALAELSGLHVHFAQPDGSYAAALTSMLGISARFWCDEALLGDELAQVGTRRASTYLSSRMVAQKPGKGALAPIEMEMPVNGSCRHPLLTRTARGSCAHVRAADGNLTDVGVIAYVREAIHDGRLPLSDSSFDKRVTAWARGVRGLSIAEFLKKEFLWWAVDKFRATIKGKRRCLHVGGHFASSVFASTCSEVDVFIHTEGASWRERSDVDLPPVAGVSRGKARRWFEGDVHALNALSGYDLVICVDVFQYFRHSYRAMAEVANVMAPGGVLIWYTPFISEDRTLMEAGIIDYYRFTYAAARRIAESAGLHVHHAGPLGSHLAAILSLIGVSSRSADADDLRHARVVTTVSHNQSLPGAPKAAMDFYVASGMVAEKRPNTA